MAYQIIWLPKAEERFDEIIDYLEKNWNDKVIADFLQKTNQKIFTDKAKTKNVQKVAENEYLRGFDYKT